MQKITTPKGESPVVLSLAEYERLVDRADIATADKVKSDIANRILAGENPARVWREHRGMSARELAAKAKLSAPYISEIENGKKEGSLSAMKKIAEVLNVDLDDLV